jgi:hypothetical protein
MAMGGDDMGEERERQFSPRSETHVDCGLLKGLVLRSRFNNPRSTINNPSEQFLRVRG